MAATIYPPVLRDIFQPILRGIFDPAGGSLSDLILGMFANSEQGGWYDPSDFASMYQDSAGTTPVTAVEQPVGLILDKSKGLVRGAELVTNGDFSAGTTGWTTGANLTSNVVAGALQLARNGAISSGAAFRQTTAYPTVIGRMYELTLDVATNPVAVRGDSGTQVLASVIIPIGVQRTIKFVAGSVTATLNFWPVDDLSTSVLDNISLKELPGNHLIQPVTTSRAVLKSPSPGIFALQADGVDDGYYTPSNVDFTATDKSSVAAGVRKLSDAATAILVEFAIASTPGTFYVAAPSSSMNPGYSFETIGTGSPAFIAEIPFPAPTSNVVFAAFDNAGSGTSASAQNKPRINGVDQTNISGTGPGNYSNDKLYMGRRNNASLPFNGLIYGLLVLGRTMTVSEMTISETYMAQKTGITL